MTSTSSTPTTATTTARHGGRATWLGVLSLAALAVILAVAALAQSSGPAAGTPLLDWQVLGPLSTTTRPAYYRAQLEVDYLAAAGGERSAVRRFDTPLTFEGREVAWQALPSDPSGRTAFVRAFPGATGPAVFYAAASFDSAGGRALLRLETVSSQRVWLNGRQVADILNPIREMEGETTVLPVELSAGGNQLLLKVSQDARTPATFGAAILPPPTAAQHALAWLPFALLLIAWGAIAVGAERARASRPDVYAPGRLVSIDALRGFDMFWITGGGLVVMLLAQRSGNYALLEQLDHQTWNGFHFWDLIFPLFLFIVGASIPFAFAKRLESGASPRSLHGHISRRAVTIFAVGLFLAGGMKRTALADLRIAGVLQRIAIGYLAGSLIYLHLGARKIAWLCAGLLLGYWTLMALVPVPGVGAGVYLPDLNLANWIDFHYLPGRMYQGTWDNEGLLSTVPAIVTCLLGVLAGIWLRSAASETRKVQGLFAGGVAALAGGWAWHLVFPVNKLLWTSSYVLVAGGWSLLLLALFYWVLDVKKWRRWSFPFIVIGANAIAVYAFEGLIDFREAAARLAGGNVAAIFGSYAEVWLALITYLLIWGTLYWLYKRRIFIKL